MSETETYNGWTNRETWAVALHINNDQGWQESVLDALRYGDYGHGGESFTLTEARQAYYNSPSAITRSAGEIIRENVEETLFGEYVTDELGRVHPNEHQWSAIRDIGSLWRVNWDELGAAFLSDLTEHPEHDVR